MLSQGLVPTTGLPLASKTPRNTAVYRFVETMAVRHLGFVGTRMWTTHEEYLIVFLYLDDKNLWPCIHPGKSIILPGRYR